MAHCLDGNPHARPSAVELVQLLQQAPGVPPGGVATGKAATMPSRALSAMLDELGGEPSGRPPPAPAPPAPQQQQILRQTTEDIDCQRPFFTSLTASLPSSPVADASRAVRQGCSQRSSLNQRSGTIAFTQAMTGAPLTSPFSLARQDSFPSP